MSQNTKASALNTRLGRFLCIIAAVVVAASGCSGLVTSTETTTFAPTTLPAEPEALSQAKATIAAIHDFSPADVGQPNSKFDAFLIEYIGTKDTEAYMAERKVKQIEAIKTCMAEAGFDYIAPVEYRIPTTDLDRASLKFAETEGFGIVSGYIATVKFNNGEALLDLDANQKYLQSLPPGEADRFLLALEGPDPEPGKLRSGGCNNKATGVWDKWSALLSAFPSMGGLAESRDVDPRMVEVRERWSECMAKEGFDFKEPDNVEASVRERMQALSEQFLDGGRVPVVLGENGVEFPEKIETLLQELSEYEVNAAKHNWTCLLAEREAIDEIDADHENFFFENNVETFTQLLADAQS